MRNRYNIAFRDPSCRLDVLIGTGTQNQVARLYYLDSTDCLPLEVNEIVAIGQSALAEVFRKSWDSNMTMEQTAKLAMLTIKYIEQERISDVIGVGLQQPQLWYIPNKNFPREITADELASLVNIVDTQVAVLRKQIHSLFRS